MLFFNDFIDMKLMVNGKEEKNYYSYGNNKHLHDKNFPSNKNFLCIS